MEKDVGLFDCKISLANGLSGRLGYKIFDIE